MTVFRTSHSREALEALIDWRNQAQPSTASLLITEIALPIILAGACLEGAIFGVSIIFTRSSGADRVVDCVCVVAKTMYLMATNPFLEEV